MTMLQNESRSNRYHSQENRRAALKAALVVFSNHGFSGATTRAIAAEAGIEQGHLAYYFPSKLALWQQVVETFIEDTEAYLADAMARVDLRDPIAAAKTVLPGYLRSFATRPRLTRMMMQEFSVQSVRFDWVLERLGRPIWQQLSPLFQALEDAGHFGTATSEMAYFSLMGSTVITFGNPDVITTLSGINTQDPAWIEGAIAHMLVPILGRSTGNSLQGSTSSEVPSQSLRISGT